MLSRILLVGLACSSYGQTYCSYNNVGWCRGGPDTSIRNADNSQPRSLDECWNRCSSRYGVSLVSADRWPNNIHFGIDLCYCQTACTSISRGGDGGSAGDTVSRVPSGLASCNRSTHPPPPPPRPPPTISGHCGGRYMPQRHLRRHRNDCCAPGSERKSCRESATPSQPAARRPLSSAHGIVRYLPALPVSGGSACIIVITIPHLGLRTAPTTTSAGAQAARTHRRGTATARMQIG